MNKEQEYIKFWMGIMEKINDIKKDYNNLSDENKRRADNVRDAIFGAQTLVDAVQIIRSQIN